MLHIPRFNRTPRSDQRFVWCCPRAAEAPCERWLQPGRVSCPRTRAHWTMETSAQTRGCWSTPPFPCYSSSWSTTVWCGRALV
ncbi:unnamed protein product [Pleuronectes platessa]|uniref:Uncharacterized protein n=1 Tax=Pleuronectes platessa TaxID=8262 RepID=A0A9N7ZAY2_PLEPL|nr:unnamed protein product [Pleuronectes platessa]